jgi:hypothetical protein
MVGILGAIPHTRLWHRLRAEGRLLQETSGDNTDGSLNFIPKMGAENLLQGYKQVVSTIYKPRYYYRRIHTFVRNYRPTARDHISKDEVKALLHSFWRIGLFSKSSLLYWKLIFKTAVTKLRALPVAIELAIYGYHFERVAKRCKKQIKRYMRESVDYKSAFETGK